MTLGSRGDVQPYVAFGVALKARGHEVAITTGRGFDDLIEAHGLISAPISDDVRALLLDPIVQSALTSISGKIKAWRHFKGETTRQLDETWAITREIQPDIIVHHLKMGGAAAFGAALNIPALPSFLMPGLVPTSAYPNPMLPVANLGAFGNRLSSVLLLKIARATFSGMLARWQRSRLPDLKSPGDPFEGFDPSGRPAPRLHAYSAHIMPKPADWGEREHVTGHWWLDDTRGWRPSDDLARFLEGGPPPVYVGFGSMPAADAEQTTRVVLDALARSGQRGVLATVWGGLAKIDLPDTVHMLETAPHSWLFPRCAAVVHHGGAGTTHEGLRWGRPTIVCPFGVDQPFWGRRMAALGVGSDPIPQKALSADKLSAALTAVRDPALIARAEALGAAIRSERGAEAAADVIERCLEAR